VGCASAAKLAKTVIAATANIAELMICFILSSVICRDAPNTGVAFDDRAGVFAVRIISAADFGQDLPVAPPAAAFEA
jgi:hypothetical protein